MLMVEVKLPTSTNTETNRRYRASIGSSLIEAVSGPTGESSAESSTPSYSNVSVLDHLWHLTFNDTRTLGLASAVGGQHLPAASVLASRRSRQLKSDDVQGSSAVIFTLTRAVILCSCGLSTASI
jgi:hypothetical protein